MLFLKETYIGMYRGREIDGFIQEFDVKPYFISILNKPNILLINLIDGTPFSSATSV